MSKGLGSAGYHGEAAVFTASPETTCEAGSAGAAGAAGGSAGGSAGAGGAGVVVVAGDAFTESNFEGCVRSARAAVAAVASHFGHAE